MSTRRTQMPVSLVVAPDPGDASDRELARALMAGSPWAIAETWHRFAPAVIMFATAHARLRIRGRRRRAGGLPPGVRQGQDLARARAAAQLHLLVRDSPAQDRAAPQENAGLALVPSTGDAGGPGRRADGHGVARSAAQVLCVARSTGAAASAGLRAAPSRVHDGGGGRRPHGPFDLDGEARAGTRHRASCRSGSKPTPGWPGFSTRRGAFDDHHGREQGTAGARGAGRDRARQRAAAHDRRSSTAASPRFARA